MELGIIITLASIAFGGGMWFRYITSRLNKLDKDLVPLIFLHKKELIEYYLDKGIMPNPSITPRKRYLMDKLEAGTISYAESQELTDMLNREEKEARKVGNTEALIAILGLIALVAIMASLLKK